MPKLNPIVKKAALDYLEAVPERFSMAHWQETVTDESDLPNEVLAVPPCSSVSCFAGAVSIVTGRAPLVNTDEQGRMEYSPPISGWLKAASEELNLTEKQAAKLFFHIPPIARENGQTGHWPVKFTKLYFAALSPAARVRVLKARIQHFERTGR